MSIERCYKRFGQNVRNIRLACGLTHEQLAKRVGLVRTKTASQ